MSELCCISLWVCSLLLSLAYLMRRRLSDKHMMFEFCCSLDLSPCTRFVGSVGALSLIGQNPLVRGSPGDQVRNPPSCLLFYPSRGATCPEHFQSSRFTGCWLGPPGPPMGTVTAKLILVFCSHSFFVNLIETEICLE